MSHARSRVPAYRLHKSSGQAVVTLSTPSGNRRDWCLGVYGSPESQAEYARLLATLAAGHPVLPATGGLDITVNEVLLAFVTWSQGHYRHPDGTPTTEVTEIIRCLKPVRQLFGTILACEFGPRKLATVRQHMIGLGWCRGAINQHVGRIKRAFRHAVAEEILPASVFESLRALTGLRRGRTEAHDNAPVMPVELAHFEAVLPFLNPHLRTMALIQRWRGMRPGEVCAMTLGQIDRSGALWVYFPKVHKTTHRLRQWYQSRVQEGGRPALAPPPAPPYARGRTPSAGQPRIRAGSSGPFLRCDDRPLQQIGRYGIGESGCSRGVNRAFR